MPVRAQLAHTTLDVLASCALYKAHLIGYLILRDLDAARFLWKRIPPACKAADTELARVWAIGKCMVRFRSASAPRATARVCASTHTAARASPRPTAASLHPAPAQWTGDRGGAIAACGAEGADTWTALLAPAAGQLRAALRAHTTELIGQSYAALSVVDAAAMLGLSAEQAAALAAQHGWAVQPGDGGGTIEPRPLPKAGGQRHDIGMGQLAQLTHLVAQLNQ